MILSYLLWAEAELVHYHCSHYPNGADRVCVSQSSRPKEPSHDFHLSAHLSACHNTCDDLIKAGGNPTRPLGHPYGLSPGQDDTLTECKCDQPQPTAMVHKAESARLTLELKLWKHFKLVQQDLNPNGLLRSIDKTEFRVWCDEDLLDKLVMMFDLKAYHNYHFWILEMVMQRANEAQYALEDVIANGSLGDATAKHFGKTAQQWLDRFDVYSVIADATRVTISSIEQQSFKLQNDLAELANSKKRFEDVLYFYTNFVANIQEKTAAFMGESKIWDISSIGDSTPLETFRAFDNQMTYIMNGATSWAIALEGEPKGTMMANATPEQKQQTMLRFLQLRADRFQAFSNLWQRLVPHIEDKIQDLVSKGHAGQAVPSTLYEELHRAQNAVASNLSAAWGMQQSIRMAKIHFNEFNRGTKAPATQSTSVEQGSLKSHHSLPGTRIFLPAQDSTNTYISSIPMPETNLFQPIAAAASQNANVPSPGAQVQSELEDAIPPSSNRAEQLDVDDLPDYEDADNEDAWLPKHSRSNENAPIDELTPKPVDQQWSGQPTLDVDDLPDYEDADNEDAWLPKDARSKKNAEDETTPKPVDQTSPGGNSQDEIAPPPPEASTERRSKSASPPSPSGNPPMTDVRNGSQSPRPSNKRKRSGSDASEPEDDDVRSSQHSSTPSPPPPPANDQPALDVRNESQSPGPSKKRKRSVSAASKSEEDDTRSPRYSPTPSPPPSPSLPPPPSSTSPPPPPPPSPPSPPAPPPSPPPPSNDQLAWDAGNASPPATSSHKRKRSDSPAEEDEADNTRSPGHSPTPSPPSPKRARTASPRPHNPSPPPPSPSTSNPDTEDDEPSGKTGKTSRGKKAPAKPKKGEGKAQAAGGTKTGLVAKPKANHKKKDWRAEANANGGVRRSQRIREIENNLRCRQE